MKTSRLYKCLVTLIMVVFCVFGAYGVPSMRYEGTSTNNHLHLGLEWQSMKGLYGYYNNARFRDALLAEHSSSKILSPKNTIHTLHITMEQTIRICITI